MSSAKENNVFLLTIEKNRVHDNNFITSMVWCVYLFQGMGSSFLVVMSFLYLHVRILQHIKYSTRKNLVKHKSTIREIFYSNIISYCLFCCYDF